MHDGGRSFSAGHHTDRADSDHYTLQLEHGRTLHYPRRLESARLASERPQTSLPDWNRYMANYKIDYRSFTLPLRLPAFARECLRSSFRPSSSLSSNLSSGQSNARCCVASTDQKRCLIFFLFAWLLVAATNTNAQTLSPNSGPSFQTAPSGATHSQSPRTVATKYGIVRGTIITLPNVNLQQVEAFLGK